MNKSLENTNNRISTNSVVRPRTASTGKSASATKTADAPSRAPESSRPAEHADAMVDLSFDAMEALENDPQPEALPNDLTTYVAPEADIDQSTPAGFADSLYEGILGRAADQAGIDHHVKALESGESDVSSLTSAFVNSEEFKNQNLSEEETVSLLYETLLNRDADSAGLEYHTRNAKEKGIDAVIADLVHSQEFADRESDGEIVKRFAEAPVAQATQTSPGSVRTTVDDRPFDQAALEQGVAEALRGIESSSNGTGRSEQDELEAFVGGAVGSLAQRSHLSSVPNLGNYSLDSLQHLVSGATGTTNSQGRQATVFDNPAAFGFAS